MCCGDVLCDFGLYVLFLYVVCPVCVELKYCLDGDVMYCVPK
jgi:hypothetical protein